MSIEEHFTDEFGTRIFVRVNRSNIEIYGENLEFSSFSLKETQRVLSFIFKNAKRIWKTFKYKEASSLASDYCEFYDKKTDNNGYLKIDGQVLVFDRRYLQEETNLWYRFNKAKCQSFIYDVFKFFPGLKVLEKTK